MGAPQQCFVNDRGMSAAQMYNTFSFVFCFGINAYRVSKHTKFNSLCYLTRGS